MAKTTDMGRIATRFDVNISALRVFNNQIGRLAEDHDKQVTEAQNNEVTQMMGVSVDELKMIKDLSPENIEELLSKGEFEQKDDVKTGINTDQKVILQKIASVDNYELLSKFLRFAQTSMRAVPIQAYILRRSALITLTSHFEYLITELIHLYYSLYPQALPSEERVLSLADLRELGSIEDAEDHLIAREIDSLLRDTLEKQLEYFSKRPKVNLDALSMYKNRLIEIFQRRNIIVHNDGLVNRIYLSRVAKELIEDNLEDGSQLDVSEKYLNEAIDCIYLSGVILIQLCWRKWQKEKVDEADSKYISILYSALLEGEYHLINRLQDFSLKLEFQSDRNKRVTIVNHAIALRELNQTQNMEKLLNMLDWSSCSLEFRAALFALRKEKKSLLSILPKAIAAKELNKLSLQEWPLFAPFRDDKEFAQFLENCPKEIALPG